MRRLLIAAVLLGMTVSAHATTSPEDRQFYFKTIGQWTTIGLRAAEEKNGICGTTLYWTEHKSNFSLVQDITDGELYIQFSWKGENFFPNRDKSSMKMQFFNIEAGKEKLISVDYFMTANQEIVVPTLPQDIFLPLFTQYTKVRLMPDGTDLTLDIDLTDSTNALSTVNDCIKRAKTLKVKRNNKADIDG